MVSDESEERGELQGEVDNSMQTRRWRVSASTSLCARLSRAGDRKYLILEHGCLRSIAPYDYVHSMI